MLSQDSTRSSVPGDEANDSPELSNTSSVSAAQNQAQHALRQSIAFAQIVSLMIQSPLYRHFAISDLEWLILPPLATGTFALAEVKTNPEKPRLPGAAVIWASVSADVDSRLSKNLSAPIRLRPDEWRSGNQVWIIAIAGDPRVVNSVLKQLNNSTLKGQNVKIRTTDKDGNAIVRTLDDIFSS